jgi:GT2 family glycosyltransferase
VADRFSVDQSPARPVVRDALRGARPRGIILRHRFRASSPNFHPVSVERSVTVGIGTRNRPESLARCLRSLRLVEELIDAVIVVDDGSDTPLEPVVRRELGALAPRGLRFIRNETSRNVAAGRNLIAREARTPWVLNLDDDAVVVFPDAIRDGVRVLERDRQVAAVAFAQADAEGKPWPAGAQPAPVDYACYVAAFIGFAHLLRREAFLEVGGYREGLGQNGEEKELCMRLLDAGGRVVYLPRARVAHLADMAGRDPRRYLHQTVRNDVLGALYNDPLPVLLADVPLRLARYFTMRKGWKIHDPGGLGTILRDLAGGLRGTLRERRPVRLSTIRLWREMGRTRPPYHLPSANDG